MTPKPDDTGDADNLDSTDHAADAAKLERFVHGFLRELPLRSAPRSLEGRVLAELSQKHAVESPELRARSPVFRAAARKTAQPRLVHGSVLLSALGSQLSTASTRPSRRAAQPWWRRSFAHWPLAVRAVFVVLCATIAKLALLPGGWGGATLDAAPYQAAVAQHFAWMESLVAVFRALGGCFEIAGRHIPALWIYGGFALFAAMYLTLFGLGAAAYRALERPRSAFPGSR